MPRLSSLPARLALSLLSAAALRAAAPDYSSLCAGLGRNPPPHPYLVFDDADKARLQREIRTDQASRETFERLRLEGLRYLNATEEPAAPPRPVHSRYVGSDDYLAYMERHANAALTLAFLFQMTGDARFAEKSFEHADRLCALDSWVQSPHRFDVIYGRVWPWGAKDDQVVFTYDITSASMSRDLALVYDWIYPAMTKAQRDRIRSGLLEKAITRVRGSYDYFWWNTASRCNWSAICHSGLGIAALALLHEDPGLTDVIAHSCRGISDLLDQVGPDGGWGEGRGYWAYGMGESVAFMEAIRRATQGKVDFFRHRALYPHPVDFALYGLGAGFGDGTGLAVGNSYLINKLVAESGDPRAAWYDQAYVRHESTVFDLIWPVPAVAPERPSEGSRLFRGINWAVLRKDFTPGSAEVACKAGFNNDPHHGHLDCGTFSLTWHNVNFIGELPRSPYDETYFGALRWEHAEAETESHNVVLVNGEEQICAKEKDQPWKSGVGGPITQYHADANWAYLEMDPTHAYPGKDLKLWHRWVVLDGKNRVVVLDRIDSAPGARIEVRFHPNVPFELTGDRAVLHGAAGSPAPRRGQVRNSGTGERVDPFRPDFARGETSDLVMLQAANGESALTQGRQAVVPMTEEDQASWAPYYSTSLPAPAGGTTWVASIFGPDGAEAPRSARLESVAGGTERVQCEFGTERFSLTFSESAVIRR
ncbi:MAG TPA: heparinase II/III family protein [Opitutaceae bacterium]|nr:heparinase II/III family protein [Opitutaceae bacterium]